MLGTNDQEANYFAHREPVDDAEAVWIGSRQDR